MKPIELVQKKKSRYGNADYYSARAEMNKILLNYGDKDVVVAYFKCPLGSVALIKGIKCCFGFVYIAIDMNSRYEIERLSIEKTIELINKAENKVILNQEIWDNELKKVVFKAI